jgi:short-subunit dehydrogenase involved in D-alanine esterification of teichoic acids
VYAKDALAGTTTAIVGGTSGVGLGSAKAIIEAGGEVIILSRTKANIDKVTKELGEKAHGY